MIDEIYKPVTFVSENDFGQLGVEDWPALTAGMIKARVAELSEHDWEVQEVQVGDAQGELSYDIWGTKE